jgi:hypothetical protein
MVKKQEKAKSIEGKFNKILKGIWEVLKHPVTILAIGTTIAIIGIVRGKATKEPVFIVSPPELIAQTVPEEEKLKILWEETKIPNVALVKIGIWNQGSRYIDKSDISSTNPIRIKPREKVDILAVQVLKTSRPTLNFDSKVERDADAIETVLIEIKGDEALEKFDGGLFHVLFSGQWECTWKVDGRIKGVPKGFQEKDWEKVQKAKKARVFRSIVLPVGIALLFFLLIIRVIMTIKNIREAKGRKEVIEECVGNALLFLLLLGFVFFLIREYYYYLSKPQWL